MAADPLSGAPRSIDEFLLTLRKHGEHGEAFAYKSVNTQVLSWIIARVCGKRIATVLSEMIWQKIGAEEDAYWLVDGAGTEIGAGSLNMTLRDLAPLWRTNAK